MSNWLKWNSKTTNLNKFKLTIIKNTNEIIKEEINDINIIHNEPEQDEPKKEPNEGPKEEETKDEEPEPEEQPEPDETNNLEIQGYF